MKVIYRAEDGAEFLKRTECLKHERECRSSNEWDKERASWVKETELLDPNQVTFVQFLDISGIIVMKTYGVKVYNTCRISYHRYMRDWNIRQFGDVRMQVVLDFLNKAPFDDHYIWHGFGYKTATVLFSAIYRYFGIDYMTKWLEQNGLIWKEETNEQQRS